MPANAPSSAALTTRSCEYYFLGCEFRGGEWEAMCDQWKATLKNLLHRGGRRIAASALALFHRTMALRERLGTDSCSYLIRGLIPRTRNAVRTGASSCRLCRQQSKGKRECGRRAGIDRERKPILRTLARQRTSASLPSSSFQCAVKKSVRLERWGRIPRLATLACPSGHGSPAYSMLWTKILAWAAGQIDPFFSRNSSLSSRKTVSTAPCWIGTHLTAG